MRWFKHMTDAPHNSKLIKVREMYGMWGLGVYWDLVARVAAEYSPEDETPGVTISVSELCGCYRTRRQKLVSYAVTARSLGLFEAKINGKLIDIEIPSILKHKDNHTANLQVTGKSLRPKRKRAELKSKEQSKINTQATDEQIRFDKFWEAYPRKKSKGAARRAFKRIDPDDRLLEKIISAVEVQKQDWNDPQYIPYPATWLNGNKWEDEPDEPATVAAGCDQHNLAVLKHYEEGAEE